MKGFKQQPEPSRKERLRGLETELKNTQMALRISQMMTQKMLENQQSVQQDMGNALRLINELQYKFLAVQKVAQLDVHQLTLATDELRLKDFNEASDKEDAREGFTASDVVEEDSTVILTTTTENLENSIFRSRIKLADCGVPDLIKALMDQKVGIKVDVQLNGVMHTVELLAIRKPKKTETTVSTSQSDS